MNQPTGVSQYSSGFYGLSSLTSSYRSLYKRRDGTAYSLSDATTGSNRSRYRTNITFASVICDEPATCAAPAVAVTYISTDSAIVQWAPGSDETSWDIYYRQGVTGEFTFVTTTSNTGYVFENLSAASDYTFRVAVVCDSDTFYTDVTATTACGILTPPYTQGFELCATNTLPSCWTRYNTGTSTSSYPYVSGSNAYTGSHSLYFYNYYSYGNQCVVLPAMDSLESSMLSFYAMTNSTTSMANSIFEIGLIDNDANDSTFVVFDTLTLTTSYTPYTFYFFGADTVPTLNRMAIRALAHTTSSLYGYFDDFSIRRVSSCLDITGLTVDSVTATSVTISWDSSNAYAWQVVIDTVPHSTAALNEAMTETVYTNPATLTGLNPNIVYYLYVRGDCSDSSSSWSDVLTFRTAVDCGDSLTLVQATVGAGATTTGLVPVYNNWGSSYSQQIYTAEELEEEGIYAGYINTISINWTSTNTNYPKHVTIYLANTDQSEYAGYTAAYLIPDTAFTQVWQDSNNMHLVGWVDYRFDTPFYYDGTNLCVAVLTNHNGSVGMTTNTASAAVDIQDSYRSVYRYRNNYQFTHADAIAFTTMGGRTLYRTAMRFASCVDMPACPRLRHLTASSITTTSASLSWVADESSAIYELEYGPAGFTLGTGTVVNPTSNTYALSGLAHSTTYEAYLRKFCDGSDTSEYSMVRFTTECADINVLPFVETFDYLSTGTAVHAPNTCWSNSSTYSSTYPYVMNNTSIHNSNFLYMYCYRNATSTSYASSITYVTLPRVDSTAISVNQTQLVLDLSRYSSTTVYGDPVVVVGVTTTPGSFDSASFTAIDTLTVPAYGDWETFEVPLSAYTGNGNYVTFYTYNPISGSSYQYSYTYTVVDNIRLEAIPTCQRVVDIHATAATANSLTIDWTDRGTPTSWIVEYGPEGFTLGTGTQIAVTQHPVTITGLTPTTYYNINVRPVCSATDTGDYCRTTALAITTHPAATIPYLYTFENATEWNNWQTSSNINSINWYRGNAIAGEGSYAMYVSRDAGAHYVPYAFDQVVNATAYRDIDFGSIDSSFSISFKARMGGNLSAHQDGLMVFLVDPTLPVVSSSASITSPWGNVNNLYRIANLRLDTVWDTYTASFDTISGIHRVAFFWFNQNTTGNIEQPAAVDSIAIDYVSCLRPVNLAHNDVTDVSASLSWQASASNYLVYYRAANNDTTHVVPATGNSITLTGLSATTTYYWAVRSVCGAGDTSLFSDSEEFTTTFCVDQTSNYDNDSLASGSFGRIPVNDFYNYTLTEIIIDSADLVNIGDINAIQLHYATSYTMTAKTNVDIYIQPTTKTAFSDMSDFEPLDSTAVLVYSGDLNCTTGWNTFGFNTAFTYSGTGNLMLIIDDNSGNYDANNYYFSTITTSNVCSYTCYADNYNPSPTSIPASGYRYTFNYRPWMKLISCGGACATPVASISSQSYDQATIVWTGTSESYEVAVKAQSDGTWRTETAVTTNTYTFTGLQPATAYQYRVRQLCDTATISDWYVGNFVTDSLHCFAPTNLAATPQSQSAVLSWTAGGNETEWMLHVFNTTFDSVYHATTNPYTVSGLTAGVTYNAAILSICGGGAVESEYGDTINFTTQSSGIDGVNSTASVTLAPNPATGNTTVTLSGVNGKVTLTVIDMSGRTVRSFTMECSGDCSQGVDVEDLSAGAYFVHLSGDGVNTVKKLIVK